MHLPFQHPDALAFLKAVKTKYKPTEVISIGDEVDYHALSFHDSNPDLSSAGDELQAAIVELKKIYKIFPKVTVVESNHGSMVLRKAIANGMPKAVLKSYNDILQAPKTWQWKSEHRVKTALGDVLFRHSFSKNILKSAQENGCSVVQGHFHEDFSLSYAGNAYKLLFGMTVGCLVDDKSMAFAYNKTFAKRPIVGVGIIIDGIPRLIPMVLNANHRWNKSI